MDYPVFVVMKTPQYKQLREQFGLKPQGMADLLGICLRQAYRYEAGANIPRKTERLLWMLWKHGIPGDWKAGQAR